MSRHCRIQIYAFTWQRFSNQLYTCNTQFYRFYFFRRTEWCKTWQLKFNPDKCETMRITHKQDKSKESYTLDPSGEILKSVKNIKDLGITISYDLSWSDHIHEVVNKANKVLVSLSACLGLKVWQNSLYYTNLSLADPGVCCSSVVPFPNKGHSFAKKSPKESVENGPRPKEGRNGLRETLCHCKMVTIGKKIVFFSDRVL